jgi:hypothetical protein
MLKLNQHRLPEWEKMLMSGQLQPKDIYSKALREINPLSAKSFGMGQSNGGVLPPPDQRQAAFDPTKRQRVAAN